MGWGILGFELGASCLLGKHSTSYAMLPALFALVILEIGSCSVQPGPSFSCFRLPAVAQMTGSTTTSNFFSVKMELVNFFCLGWPETVILPISASLVARITGTKQ
jgi:hypothetical protein